MTERNKPLKESTFKEEMDKQARKSVKRDICFFLVGLVRTWHRIGRNFCIIWASTSKGIANRVSPAIPFRNAQALEKSSGDGSLQNRSFVADRTEFWWDPKHPDERSLWMSKIRLGEDFFNEIISCPVAAGHEHPEGPQAVLAGPGLVPVATYRTFALRAPLRLSWRSLYRQFGANPARAGDKNTVNRFRTECLRELKKIKVSWPELHYSTARGVLILHPSTPAIPPPPEPTRRFFSNPHEAGQSDRFRA